MATTTPRPRGEGGKITLTVNVFGNFGYQDLYKEFQASHPNVKIVERGTGSDLSNYTPALTKNLAAGSGAGDVVALEEGIMIQFKEQAQNFADLGEYGGNDDRGNFLPWKFEGGLASDGKKLIGLGTDVGSMGMCYRRDIFAKAGLPTDREAVAALWPTWQDYVTVGNQFKAKQHRGEVVRRGVQHVQHDPGAGRPASPRATPTSTGTTSWSSSPTRRSSRRTTRCSP